MITLDTESEGILSQDEVDKQNRDLIESHEQEKEQEPPAESETEPAPDVPSSEQAAEQGKKCFDLV